MTSLTIRQKAFLLLLSLCISLIILEIGLRIGGFIFLIFQERRNQISLAEKKEYRILCLGESTTALGGDSSWPVQLEKFLNRENRGIKFKVINKGVPATNTTGILRNLKRNLDKYQPDMVITMMGINDAERILPYSLVEKSPIRNLKTYKLFKILSAHIVAKTKNLSFGRLTLGKGKKQWNKNKLFLENVEDKKCSKVDNLRVYRERFQKAIDFIQQKKYLKAERLLMELQEENPEEEDIYVALGWCYREQKKYKDAMRMDKKAISLDPKNSWAYGELGNWFKDQGYHKKAEEMYRKALEFDPDSSPIYVDLGNCLKEQGYYKKAEAMYEKALKINPNDFSAYIALADFYKEQGLYRKAYQIYLEGLELKPDSDYCYAFLGWFTHNLLGLLNEGIEFSQRAVEINPRNIEAYYTLGKCYEALRDYSEAIKVYQRLLEIDPKNHFGYASLGQVYLKMGELEKAEDIFKRGLEIYPKSDILYGGLALIYQKLNKDNLTREYFRKGEELRMNYYNPMTCGNYQKIREVLIGRGTKFVSVQYPMRSLESLKKMFDDSRGIIFVDNEKIFKEAVRREGYDAYFIDNFAGDFGHCTPKGNRLLAENIGRVILREVFQK